MWNIQSLPVNSVERTAELSVMTGRVVEAESILMHNSKFREAIELCLRMHRWERALEIAKSQKNETDLDYVLSKRKKYLAAIDSDEYLPEYLK